MWSPGYVEAKVKPLEVASSCREELVGSCGAREDREMQLTSAAIDEGQQQGDEKVDTLGNTKCRWTWRVAAGV